jgi:hypothetical protein
MYGVCGANRDDMFVNVTSVHVVEMAIMKMVNMVVTANRRVHCFSEVRPIAHCTIWISWVSEIA